MPKLTQEQTKAAGGVTSDLDDLVEKAVKDGWCTTPFCATCGAHEFRNELNKIPREKVVEGLRTLPADFLAINRDLFQVVVLDIAYLPQGRDLLDDLAGTAAGEELQRQIDHWDSRMSRVREAEEAIARGKLEREASRRLTSEVHNERKKRNDLQLQQSLLLVKEKEGKALVDAIRLIISSAPSVHLMRSLGGHLHPKLEKAVRANSLADDEVELIKQLGAKYSGHWAKLVTR